MLSLDNAFSINDLTDFNKRVNPKEKFNNLKFSCEPKMDGVAISIRYKDGFFHSAGTRGDGKHWRRRNSKRKDYPRDSTKT